ncbi:MAG: cytochrome C oxidase subunit II [Deltaproteobacteria bacterium]|nr:cytochrome C oxidase subunit II [Deltaproteobacteria bacterium]
MNALGVGLPPDASIDAGRLDVVLHDALFAVSAIFLGCLAVLLVALVRHGRRHTAAAESGATAGKMLRSAGVALGLLGIVDGALFVNALRHPTGALADFAEADKLPGVVRIELNAHQWAWDARYAGADGVFGTADDVTSLNRIVVPEGAPVLVELAATDVIHSFFVPALRLKRDAVPGRIGTVSFTATTTGTFEIACAQLCGVNHYKMRGELEVVSPSEYATWLARGSDLATRGYDPDDKSAHWAWPWMAAR